ncbi:MAG: diacylglycerol kinase family protein [Sphingobacteriales bacterium JAD_PAG50586_3]|nr:MAG: diacylglycerol kinase family protein [Sphingobacteriales bacterium JAD_PAG50586_3]
MKNFFSITRLVKSLGYSFKGMLHVIINETNVQIHLLALIVTTFAGYYFDITRTEWMVQTLVIAAVISAEFFNTAIEEMIDLLHPEQHPKAGLIKDIASAAVMVLAIGAVFVAYFIYGERIEKIL